jgi:hypothetical protein
MIKLLDILKEVGFANNVDIVQEYVKLLRTDPDQFETLYKNVKIKNMADPNLKSQEILKFMNKARDIVNAFK